MAKAQGVLQFDFFFLKQSGDFFLGCDYEPWTWSSATF